MAEPTRGSDDALESDGPMGSVDPVDPVDSVTRVKSVRPVGSADPVGSVEPIGSPAHLQWPMALVLIGIAGAIGITWTDHWRKGAFAFGFAVTVGGVLRLVLPTRVAGWLAVRRRWVDASLLLITGLALMAITLIVPPSPPPSQR